MKKITSQFVLAVLCLLIIQTKTNAQILFQNDFEFGPPLDTTIINGFGFKDSPNITGINGIVEVANIATCGGQFLARLGKSTDGGGFTANGLDLYVNLLGQTKVDLSFSFLSNYEETNPQDGIYLKKLGDTLFYPVFRFEPELQCQANCASVTPLHLEELAALAGFTVDSIEIIRFEQYDNADFTNSGIPASDRDGIYIDNIIVYVPNLAYATLPYQETFETGVLNNNWSDECPDITALPAVDICKSDGDIAVGATWGNASTYAVRLAKLCEGNGYNGNAFDLHLNLDNVDSVVVSFDIKDNYQEVDSLQDFVFFSNNGGNSFVRAFYLNFSALPDNQYVTKGFSIDSVAISNGLSLTDSCIIRFQQYGDADISNSGIPASDRDGFYLDNINVVEGAVTTNIKNMQGTSNFSLYPNPVRDNLNIIFSESRNNQSIVTITNMLGREVYSKNFSNQSNMVIDVNNFPNGIYFININTENESLVQKFIKD